MHGVEKLEELQQQHVELARRLYAAFARQDIPALLTVLDPEVNWLFFGPAEIPFAGHYHGHAEVAKFFALALESAEFLRFEPREFIPGASTVLVQGSELVRVRANGRVWETDWAHVFTISSGKIVKMREYYDTAVMVAAFRGEG